MNPWDRIKKELEAKLSPESYQNWISRIDFLGKDGATLLLSAPDETTRKWTDTEYTPEILSIANTLALGVDRIEYALASAREADFEGVPVNILNPKFTFDSFVVGACNQFAHAARSE